MGDHFVKLSEIPKGKRLSYFWDYYKIHTIVGILLIVAVISIVKATVFRTVPDSEILIVTSGNKIHSDYIAKAEDILSTLPIDFNNDGKAIAEIQSISVSQADAPQDAELEYATQLKLSAVLTTAECIIQIADEDAYNFLDAEGLTGTYDELSAYGFSGSEKIKVPLSETPLSDQLISPYEDELYLTLRPKAASLLTSEKKEENYENQLKLLAELIK